jgi:hypothetical protein
MSSIFIWKSDNPVMSDNTTTYYNGSNWFLEESSSYSKSYKYLDQYYFSGVQCYLVKEMPLDWTGNYLLEKLDNIPYCLLKDDEYATLEQIGKWLRCKLKKSIDFEEKELETQWNSIQDWIKIPTTYNKLSYPNTRNKHYHPSSFNKLNRQMDKLPQLYRK